MAVECQEVARWSLPNFAVDRTAGSHSLAAAGHRSVRRHKAAAARIGLPEKRPANPLSRAEMT